eukprot:gene3130-5882_t
MTATRMTKGCFVVLAITLIITTTFVTACGRWVQSTPIAPISDAPFRAEWTPYYPSYDKNLYFCSCNNYTGSLWNEDAGYGPGWKCWYSTSSSNTQYCPVGKFYVLVSDFPTSSGPSFQNSTESRPVPKNSIPGRHISDQFSCVQYSRKLNAVVPGALLIDVDTGNYICRSATPNGYFRSRDIINSGPGEFAAVVGSSC